MSVLSFPQRNKGRVRKTQSMYSMGRCALSQFETDEEIPGNVADIRAARMPVPQTDDGRLALRLAMAIFATLGPEQKKNIISATKYFARHDDGWHGDESRALYRLLTGDRLPC